MTKRVERGEVNQGRQEAVQRVLKLDTRLKEAVKDPERLRPAFEEFLDDLKQKVSQGPLKLDDWIAIGTVLLNSQPNEEIGDLIGGLLDLTDPDDLNFHRVYEATEGTRRVLWSDADRRGMDLS